MKIRPGTRMTEGPQAGFTVMVFQDRAYTQFEWVILPENGAEIDNHIKPQIIFRPEEGTRQRLEG